jgi:enoyl-CoA hydratase/carnithine racemase
MNNVVSEKLDDCVRIRLSNGAANTQTTEVLREVTLALDEAETSARGIMLYGGDKFFSNGIDLDWALAQSTSGMRTLFLELGGCILKLMELYLPIVGVAKGHAIGGALAILLACDYR